MRLGDYPFHHIQVACTKCPRAGRYRLARAIAHHGADLTLPWFLGIVARDCPRRNMQISLYDWCGAYFLDIAPDDRKPWQDGREPF